MDKYIKTVKVLFTGPDKPEYKTLGSAGMDLVSVENGYINPGEYKLVKTGLRIELPVGYEAQVRPRSGLALKHGVTVLNTPGTVDSDYRGVIGVILINHGKEQFTYNNGDRIAQLVICKHAIAEMVECDELGESSRGTGGFGSTGK